MFKTREDGSILFAKKGWLSKQSYVLPTVRLKNCIRYARLAIYLLPIPFLFAAVAFTESLVGFSVFLLFGLDLVYVYSHFEKKWLANCEVVNEKVTIMDAFQDRWLVSETRRWRRILDALIPLLSIAVVGLYLYGLSIGWNDKTTLQLRESSMFEVFKSISVVYIVLMAGFTVLFYRDDKMMKIVRSLVFILIITSIMMFGFVVLAFLKLLS